MLQLADLTDLTALGRFAADDVLLAQGGGGNCSIKDAAGEEMAVKASGFRLSDVAPDAGWVALPIAAALADLDDPALEGLDADRANQTALGRLGTLARFPGERALRPSLETHFHACLGRAVLHLHPVYVNAFACMDGGRALLEEALGQPVAWVPYAQPGYPLALAVRRVAEGSPGGSGPLFVLESHGLVAQGGDVATVLEATARVLAAGEAVFGRLDTRPAPQPAATRAWAEGLREALAAHFGAQAPVVAVPALGALAEALPADPGPLVPDDVVLGLGRWLEAEDEPAGWLSARREPLPEAFCLRIDGGVVLVGPNAAFLTTMEENLRAHLAVRALVARRGRVLPLPEAAAAELDGMEAEAYRRRRLAGRALEKES